MGWWFCSILSSSEHFFVGLHFWVPEYRGDWDELGFIQRRVSPVAEGSIGMLGEGCWRDWEVWRRKG